MRTGPHTGHKTRPLGATNGLLRPPILLQHRRRRRHKNSSQADSAGSIPVTRSTREKCCNTSESGAISQIVSDRRHQKSALVPLPRAITLLGERPFL